MVREYLAVDIETTGLSPQQDRIIEIGAVRYIQGKPEETFSVLIRPDRVLSEKIVELTGITDAMLADATEEEDTIQDFLEFANGWTLLGHNLPFDYSFLKTAAVRYGKTLECCGIDTLVLSRILHRGFTTRSLGAMCKYYGIINTHAHRALDDAYAAAQLYECLFAQFGTEKQELFQGAPLQFQPKKQEPITQKQKKYLLALAGQYQLTLEQKIDSLTKSEASKIIDGILSTYGYGR